MAVFERMRGSTDDRPPIAAIEDVRKVYRRGEPVEVLGGVSLSLPRGSYTAIMGPSGSGKSTLLNLVGCLDRPTSGRVFVDGTDVTALDDAARTRVRREQVGFVFQSFNLIPKLTATENVALPLVFAGVDRAKRRDRANALLETVGLAHRGDHRPNELSGGQRQRVAVARALANDPPMLLADEPTGSLDTETGDRIMATFDALHDAGTAILLVTHERPIAERADHIVHVLDGRIERVEVVADDVPDADVPETGATASDAAADSGETPGAPGTSESGSASPDTDSDRPWTS